MGLSEPSARNADQLRASLGGWFQMMNERVDGMATCGCGKSPSVSQGTLLFQINTNFGHLSEMELRRNLTAWQPKMDIRNSDPIMTVMSPPQTRHPWHKPDPRMPHSSSAFEPNVAYLPLERLHWAHAWLPQNLMVLEGGCFLRFSDPLHWFELTEINSKTHQWAT